MAGVVSKILSFVNAVREGVRVSDVEINPSGGDNITAEHSAPAGIDCQPLASDSAVAVPVQGEGRFVVVGYFDPDNPPEAGPGEVRLYARDSSGAEVVDLHVKNDGSIEAVNAAGNFSLQANGTFLVNGVTITPDGTITTPTTVVAAVVTAPSILANGKDVADHTHPAGTPPGNTGANN